MLPSWDPGATLPTWKSGRSYIGFPNVDLTLHRRNRARVPLSILNRDGIGKVASPSPRKPNPLLILARIALYGASVFLVFTVTLGCFPAITMLVQSTGVMQCMLRAFCDADRPSHYIISNSTSAGSLVVVVDRLLRARGVFRSLQRRRLDRPHPRRAPHLAETGQGKLRVHLLVLS